MILFIAILVVGLPIAWLASEYQPKRWLPIALGVASLTMAFGVFFLAAQFERLNYNAWYSSASKGLLDSEIAAFEAGRTEELLSELKRLRDECEVTYEHRGNFDELAQQTSQRLEGH